VTGKGGKGPVVKIVVLAAYGVFVGAAFALGFEPGRAIAGNFGRFALQMVRIVPCAFVLIGLFEVWVDRERVERHMGEESGLRGHLWAIVLAGTNVGGIMVALPMAHSLCRKGAGLAVVFTFVTATAICRVPMTVFEASFLGAKFTLIRFCVSLPLVVASSVLLARWLAMRGVGVPGEGEPREPGHCGPDDAIAPGRRP